MFEIKSYTVEKMNDPFGILSGDRYEFFLEIEVPEDDELYTDKGIMLRVIFVVDNQEEQISKYEFIENGSEEILDFELEEDEVQMVKDFCSQHTDLEEEDNI